MTEIKKEDPRAWSDEKRNNTLALATTALSCYPPSTSVTIEDLSVLTYSINAANGWDVTVDGDWDNSGPYKIPTKLALIQSEASEALEAFRKKDYDNFKEELADVAIRVFDLAYGLSIDLEDEIVNKLKKNANRGFRHGGKQV